MYLTFTALIASTAAALTGPVSANDAEPACELSVSARFNESAPRDYFYISNNSTKPWAISEFNINLGTSAGNLIFDTKAGGKGVEVFQLFDVADGSANMSGARIPDDGETELQVSFDQFTAGNTFSFSIDVDDQLTDSELGQIRVAGSEIAGSEIQIQLVNDAGEQRTQLLRFNDKNKTVIEVSGCPVE